MATEQQLLDALEQSIANTDRGNSDLLLVMKEGNLNDVTLRDNSVVPSLSKRVKTSINTIGVFSTLGAGLVPARVGTEATKYLREDGTWVTPTNTTYTTMTQAEAYAGTSTTGRTVGADVLKAAINKHAPSLVNDLTTGGIDKALTAEMGKLLLSKFTTNISGPYIYFSLPNNGNMAQPIIVIIGTASGEVTAGINNNITFPFAFPNSIPYVLVCNGDGVAARNNVISVSQNIQSTGFSWISNNSGATRANYIAIGY